MAPSSRFLLVLFCTTIVSAILVPRQDDGFEGSTTDDSNDGVVDYNPPGDNRDAKERKKVSIQVRIVLTAFGILAACFIAFRVCTVLNRRHRGPPPPMPSFLPNDNPSGRSFNRNTLKLPHKEQYGSPPATGNPNQPFAPSPRGFEDTSNNPAAYYPPVPYQQNRSEAGSLYNYKSDRESEVNYGYALGGDEKDDGKTYRDETPRQGHFNNL